LRLLIALLVLTPIMIVRRQPFPRGRRTWTLLASTGFLLLAVNYGLVFWGARYVSSGLMCFLQAMTPVFGAMFTRSLLPASG
jgi:drug/metabolite transporter (DMT)-like permease